MRVDHSSIFFLSGRLLFTALMLHLGTMVALGLAQPQNAIERSFQDDERRYDINPQNGVQRLANDRHFINPFTLGDGQ